MAELESNWSYWPWSAAGAHRLTKRRSPQTLPGHLQLIAHQRMAAISVEPSTSAWPNGRLGELGYSKITNILSALGLELKLQEARSRRPTLEDLMEEGRNDKGLDRRH